MGIPVERKQSEGKDGLCGALLELEIINGARDIVVELLHDPCVK